MKVLARFPALDPAAITIAGGAAPSNIDELPVPGSAPTATASERRGRRPRPPLQRQRRLVPGGSLVALAVLAGIAWTLATWSDARRLERSRAERLARMQTTFSSPGTLAR